MSKLFTIYTMHSTTHQDNVFELIADTYSDALYWMHKEKSEYSVTHITYRYIINISEE